MAVETVPAGPALDALAGTATPSILWKAFAVLGSFSQSRRVLRLAEIARRSGLPKSTVHRVLGMLLELGAIERHGEGYRLGVRMFSMAACSPEIGGRDLALPHLEELHRVTGQTLHLAVLRGPDVVYLDKLRSRSTFDTPAVVGGRLPAHCTAVGKALLAFTPDVRIGPLAARTGRTITSQPVLERELDRVRATRVATDQEETAPGLACLAVPVLLQDHAVAAISVAYPARAGGADRLVNALLTTSAAVSRTLFTSPGYAGVVDV